MHSRTVLLCLLAATAGCTAPVYDRTVATDSPNAQNSTTSDTTTADFSCIRYEPVAGLDLSVSEGTSAHLTVTTVESGTPVVDRAVAGGEHVVFHGSEGVFEPRTEYRVVIRTSGSVRWNRTIRRTEEAKVTVEQNGRVTLEATILEDTPTPCLP